MPAATAKQPEIDAIVSEIERELAADVVRVRYDFGEDWSGDDAIFFRVVLNDAASKPAR